jgi:hypothetical protein
MIALASLRCGPGVGRIDMDSDVPDLLEMHLRQCPLFINASFSSLGFSAAQPQSRLRLLLFLRKCLCRKHAIKRIKERVTNDILSISPQAKKRAIYSQNHLLPLETSMDSFFSHFITSPESDSAPEPATPIESGNGTGGGGCIIA